MVIYPEIQVTPDRPAIRFSQPRDQIDLQKELPRILHAQGWGCGTYFDVQFLNHEKTKLLSCGVFVVSEEIESIQTNDANPYQPMTKTVFSRAAMQIGEWWPASNRGVESVDDNQTFPVSSETAQSSSPFIVEPKRRGRPPKSTQTVNQDGI